MWVLTHHRTASVLGGGLLSRERSHHAFSRARQVIPGGVDSPVRAFGAVGGEPPFIDHGSGPWIFDIDGNRYVDMVLSWGPLILGHAHPDVVQAVADAAARGTSFGAPTEGETELASLIASALPSVEEVRFVSSGTEAVMSALRLARAATGRTKVLKFSGSYHGHSDSLLVDAGSGALTLGVPSSPGVPAAFVGDTLLCPYNDLAAVQALFAEQGREIAAVVVEPVAGNMGLVPAVDGFLAGLRQLTQAAGALLVFDEVITGFRVAWGGAQVLYGIEPDLTCLGKVIGGGLPLAAYAGRRELMEQVAPAGPVYQAGTLSGNPVAVQAGLTTLKQLQHSGAYERLAYLGERWRSGLEEAAHAADVEVTVNGIGSTSTLFFRPGPVRNLADASDSDTGRYARWFHGMLDRGVYLSPSQFETQFISLAHTEAEIDGALAAARQAFPLVSAQG